MPKFVGFGLGQVTLKLNDPGFMQALTINPNELDAALKHDQATAETGREENGLSAAIETKSYENESRR